MDLSTSFNVADFADLLLVFVCPSEPADRANDAAPAAAVRRELFVHKVVLSAGSDFFRACMQRRWSSDGGAAAATASAACGSSGARRPELEVLVQDGDLDAAEMVIRWMYLAAPRRMLAADGQMLLRGFRLADMLGVPACRDACAAALTALALRGADSGGAGIPGAGGSGRVGGGCVDEALMRAAFALPEGLREATALAPLLRRCERLLLATFRDVPAVLTSDELRARFCALPHAAVLFWLRSDALAVHSESCVALLLSAHHWANAAGESCNAAELEQLAHHVRLLHLSPSYLHVLLPRLPLFQGCDALQQHLPMLLLRRDVSAGRLVAGSWGGPPAWTAPPRTYQSGAPAVDIDWVLGEGELRELFALKRVRSTTFYANGLFLRLVTYVAEGTTAASECPAAVGPADATAARTGTAGACSDASPSSTAVALRLGVVVHEAAMRRCGVAGAPVAVRLGCRIVAPPAPPTLGLFGGGGGVRDHWSGDGFGIASCAGFHWVVQCCGSLKELQQALGGYLNQGRLCVKVSIRDVC